MNRNRRRALLGAALAALLSAGAISAGAAGSTSNSGTRGVILFLGDSNITLAAANIDWALTEQTHRNNGYVPVLASRVGASVRAPDCLDETTCTTFDYWLQKLASLEGKIEPDAIVVNLGVIDTGSVGTVSTPGYANYSKKIDWFMALTGDTPVFWTNLPCAIEPLGRADACLAIDYHLSLAPARWPNLTVLDWNSRASTHPEYMLPGDVHYTPLGHERWTNFVVSALDARFPAL